MTPGKRLMDIGLALVLGTFLLPVLAILMLVIALRDGRPVLYGSERMRAPGRPFTLWKLRTMTVDAADSGVSGGDKAARITPTGRLLRRTRLDELPQLWNILRGDLSFVGPRPPLRQYVERFPALYAEVLQSRPGVTGLATLTYHRHEERLLARCATAAETDAVYARACIPRKARLDLIYRQNRTLCWDLVLIARTAGRVLPGSHVGARARPGR
ncbi:MAG TPA: sugar transferase [Rhodobacteraceae bacterium]|jgi:lipopolysaccharide/colanic/teichoic acid biosynthesis glycosyltransferase|nr:sugar transferase [Paracoccaceae bacterium]HBG97881.1 sugar transferase [Paracoccaceae bacterium]